MGDLGALVGRNVRRLRLAAGVSQEELSFRSGIDRTYLSDVERGLGNPSVKWLQDVAAALETHPILLIAEEGEAALLRRILQGDTGDVPP